MDAPVSPTEHDAPPRSDDHWQKSRVGSFAPWVVRRACQAIPIGIAVVAAVAVVQKSEHWLNGMLTVQLCFLALVLAYTFGICSQLPVYLRKRGIPMVVLQAESGGAYELVSSCLICCTRLVLPAYASTYVTLVLETVAHGPFIDVVASWSVALLGMAAYSAVWIALLWTLALLVSAYCRSALVAAIGSVAAGACVGYGAVTYLAYFCGDPDRVISLAACLIIACVGVRLMFRALMARLSRLPDGRIGTDV